jgi:hypothetical protein
MATFGVLALTFGPCIAVCLWLLNQGKLTKEERAEYARQKRNERQFFGGAEIPVKKRPERIKAFLAHQAEVRQYAKDHPDEFQ